MKDTTVSLNFNQLHCLASVASDLKPTFCDMVRILGKSAPMWQADFVFEKDTYSVMLTPQYK